MKHITIAEMIQIITIQTLHKFKGNRTTAAKALGIARRTLLNRMAEYRKGGCMDPIIWPERNDENSWKVLRR